MDNIELDTEAFIRAIEEKPVIWDKTLENYKHRNETKAAWEEIYTMFIENYKEMSDSLKAEHRRIIMKKWINIRDSYVKCYKKIHSINPHVGYKRVRKYIFYDRLNFLTKIMDNNTITTNTSSDFKHAIEEINFKTDVDADDTYNSIPSPSTSSASKQTTLDTNTATCMQRTLTSSRRKKKRDNFKTKVLNILKNNANNSINEDRSFLDSILPTIEKFDDDQKLEFRLEVLKLIKNIKGSSQK